MSRAKGNDLGRAIVAFFSEYLPEQRGLSHHSIQSYRDALVLWLRFAADDTKRRIERLELDDLTAESVERFLLHLESDRKNSVRTRNVRLAALHTFARYLTVRHPDRLGAFQGILNVPFKRGTFEQPIDYLEAEDIAALLGGIDRKTPSGRRDYALFAVMFNTGARVQEVLNLRASDLRLDPPEQVRLQGKGNKVRLCPLWPKTAKLLRDLVEENATTPGRPTSWLFANRSGGQLTRFGVRYLLRKYLPDYLTAARRRKLHPHSLRHTTAVHLLKAGVDFATISQWLGHAGLAITMRYARADMDLKRQALAQVFPDALGAPKAGAFGPSGTELTRWLRRL